MPTYQTQIAQMAQQARRQLRSPQHRWHIRGRPMALMPFLLAPVLPGETLKRAMFQTRAVSDPIVNPLIGAWKEYYFFYVKHRDLAIRDDMEKMVLDSTYDIASVHGEAADTKYYHGRASTMNWAKHCLKEVTEWYFRAEGEAWDIQTTSGYPTVKSGMPSFLDSAITQTDYAAIDQTIAHTTGTPDTSQASDTELALVQYEFLKEMGLVDMDYEQYLATFGVRVQEQELHKPELLRYVREWTYPTNHIDPADGSPTSAWSWSVRDRIDKDRFFSEPGWIFGCTVTRPKLYYNNLRGSMADFMDDIYTWLPGLLTNEARTRLKSFANTEGPVQNQTDGYWVDVADLLLYGDEFKNFSLGVTDAGMVALPTAAMDKKYPIESEIDSLFVDSVTPTSDVNEDGVINMSIATRIEDRSRAVGTI